MKANRTSPRSSRTVRIVGLTLAGLGIFAGGGAVYLWFGVLKPYAEGLERPRVPLLKKVAVAQIWFRVRDLDHDGIRDYADLKELINAKLLTDREVHQAGFVFIEPATSDPENSWWAVAQPLHPMQGRAFFTNQAGIIYFATDELYLESRVDRKSGEVPAGVQVMKRP